MFIVCWLTAQAHRKFAGNRFHRSRRHHRSRRRFFIRIFWLLLTLSIMVLLYYAVYTIKATFRNSYFRFVFFFRISIYNSLGSVHRARLGANVNVRLLQCRPIFLIL